MRSLLPHFLLCLFCQIAAAQDAPLEVTTGDEPSPPAVVSADYDLNDVKDDYWLTNEESPAYYGLLNQALQANQAELRSLGSERVRARRVETRLPTFVDLLKNPQAWRGEPVFLTGHVLQTVEYESAPNPYGIGKLFESSLFIEDSQGHPITVVFTDKPANLPVSGDLVDGVEVAGYFLKLYWYPSSDKRNRIAPLVLAKTVTVRPPLQAEAILPPAITYGVMALAVLVTLAIVWRLIASMQRRPVRNASPEEPPVDFRGLN